ncbi:MAG: mechanosensitive ion channel [Rhodothermales bacterium]
MSQSILPALTLIQDSVKVAVPDSLAAADSVGALRAIGRQVSETGSRLVSGEIDQVWQRLTDGMINNLIDFIPNLIGALFVLVFFYAVYRIILSVLVSVLTRSAAVDPALQHLLTRTFKISVSAFIGIMVLSQFGINVTALLTGLGIAGIAVGFAARDSLENFISGVTILIDRPFNLGDRIVIEDVYGAVEEITLRSTRVRTLDNTLMVMPNVTMINQKLVNHSRLGLIRVEIPFGVAYKEKPSEVRDVLTKLTKDDHRIHPDFKPEVVVKGLNDSSIDMALRIFIDDPSKEVAVKWDYFERIRESLREADIEIPFPHMQVFLEEEKALADSFLTKPKIAIAGDSKAA